jgi:hypothetical protein
MPDLDVDRSQHVLMYKHCGEVLAREIDAAAFAALASLARGETVEEAIDCAVGCDPGFGPAEVSRLFELIALCGLVESVER